jgi:hypothetical protein
MFTFVQSFVECKVSLADGTRGIENTTFSTNKRTWVEQHEAEHHEREVEYYYPVEDDTEPSGAGDEQEPCWRVQVLCTTSILQIFNQRQQLVGG